MRSESFQLRIQNVGFRQGPLGLRAAWGGRWLQSWAFGPHERSSSFTEAYIDMIDSVEVEIRSNYSFTRGGRCREREMVYSIMDKNRGCR